VGLIAALGVAGWSQRSKGAEEAPETDQPTVNQSVPFAGRAREAPPAPRDGLGRERTPETNRSPAGLLSDPIWLGAVQIAQEAYALKDQAEDMKASGDLTGYAAKAVAAREGFGKAIDASRAFEDTITESYGENDRQVKQVTGERNRWFDLRAKYRKVKSG